MTIFEGDIENRNELEKWREQLGIKVHPNVSIRNTKDRGIGVFYRPGKQLESDSSECIGLMRIPHNSTYNIYTLKTLVDEKLDEEDRAIVKKTLNVIFTRSRGGSESLILIAYFIAFLFICKKRKIEKADGAGAELKQEIGTYVSVLLGTTVGNLYGDQQDVLEDFLSAFPGNAVLKNSIADITGGFWEEVTETLNEEFGEDFNAVEVNDVLQLCGAVRSRVLEIPRAVGEGEDGSGSGGDDDDDYYVDVTLVPLLDYVNHDNERRNAYFDVERASQDVVLYLELDGAAGEAAAEKEVEVYISYDLYEDLHRMFVNYGFFPRNEARMTVIDIPILGYCDSKLLSDYEITRRLHCLRQTPNVQFRVLFDGEGAVKEVAAVLDEFYSYLAFKDDVEWDEFEKEDEEAVDREAVDTEAELETDFLRGFARSRELAQQLDEEETRVVLHKFCQYLREFFDQLGARSRQFGELVREYELSERDTTNVLRLVELYEDLSSHVAKSGTEDARLLDTAGASIAEGYLANRMVPVYNFGAAADGVEIGQLEL